MRAEQYLRQSRILVWEDSYSVYKVRTFPPEFTAAIADPSEKTVVARSGTVSPALILEEEPGWKILTFEAELPFELVGFLAIVATRLAEAGISVFALSAYSTDHIMVKEEHLERALEVLRC